MSAYIAQIGPTLLALLAGWVILWSIRHRVGPVLFHLSAASVGLVSFAVAAAASTLAGTAFGPLVLAGAVALLAGLVSLLARGERAGRDRRQEVPVSGFFFTAAGMVFVGGVTTFMGATIATNDALVWYWPMSLELARDGAYSSMVFSTRGTLIPAFGAVHALMGADWAFAAYPLVATQVLALVGLSLRRLGAATGMGKKAWLPAMCAVVFLILEPSFIFQAFFVHSHMLSALYLLIAGIALWEVRALEHLETDGGSRDRAVAALVVAGFATAGLALVRPDGIAYAMVVVAAAVAALTRPGQDARRTSAYFSASAGVVAFVYLASLARLGLWESDKLSGVLALGVLGVLCASSLLPVAVRLLAEKTPIDVRSDRFLVFAIGVVTAAHAAVAIIMPDSLVLSVHNGVTNLLGGGGGYGPLWYLFAGMLALSVVTGDAIDCRAPRASVFMTIVLFFLVASMVHATTHPGRIGDLDSFTRVAFHVIPLGVWYAATIVVRIIGDDGHLRT